MKPDISILIPVYNEQDNLKKLFEEIKDVFSVIDINWELLFVDDASTDDSCSIIKNVVASNPEVRFISFEANRGQSAAFCAGFDAAKAEIVITMDADLQNDPSDIPRMLELYRSGYDMVIGWRVARRDTLAKRMASKIANFIRNKITHDNVRDTGCSLKVMNAQLVKNLPRFNGMHRFLPSLMKMEGARIAEQTVNHRPRYSGESKYGNWDRAIKGLYDLMGVQWIMKRHLTYIIKERSYQKLQS